MIRLIQVGLVILFTVLIHEFVLIPFLKILCKTKDPPFDPRRWKIKTTFGAPVISDEAKEHYIKALNEKVKKRN